MEKVFDREFLDELFREAEKSQRKRQHFDLRNSDSDTSQRMLNALLPGTEVPVHRHENTAETVVCLSGELVEVLYEKTGECFIEVSRHLISPENGVYGMQIPAGVWHTVIANKPSVIFEAKDGAYKAL